MSDSLNKTDLSGTLQSEKEKIYLGEYHGRRTYDGLRDGYAWCILPNSDIYVGNYYRGLRHGKGLYCFKNGSRYNGYWKKNLKHGHGKMVYPDGTYYEGDWKRNLRHGYGEYFYLNGDTYKGYWKNGKRHGLGVYFYLHLNVTVKSTWYNGFQNGPGKILYPPFTYCGTWVEGICAGKGIYTFYNKCIQEGLNVELPKEPELPTSLAEDLSHSQFVEPEGGLAPGSLGEGDEDYVKMSSELGEQQHTKIETEWSPLKILKYDVNLLPPEPTYDNASILFSEDTLLEEQAEEEDKGSFSESKDKSVEDSNSKLSLINEEAEESNSELGAAMD